VFEVRIPFLTLILVFAYEEINTPSTSSASSGHNQLHYKVAVDEGVFKSMWGVFKINPVSEN